MDNSVEEVTDELPIELPRWLEDLLPEQSAPQVLSTTVVDGERVLRLTEPDGSYQDFATVAEVASAQRNSELDLAIEQDVYEHFADGYRSLSYPVERKGYVGMLFGYTDERRRKSLESAYRYSLENQNRYAEDPTDFLRAYRFIDTHPAFWTTFDLEKHPWHWETNGYCGKLRQFVSGRDDGSYRFALDGGGHVEHSTGDGRSAYSEHYGDWRLEARGNSFEEAILDFAARLVLAYDSEGNGLSEDGFPYPIPEWVQDLRRIDADEEL